MGSAGTVRRRRSPAQVRAVSSTFGTSQTRWAARSEHLGILRARSKIGMMNLGYNIRRRVQLERWAAPASGAYWWRPCVTSLTPL